MQQFGDSERTYTSGQVLEAVGIHSFEVLVHISGRASSQEASAAAALLLRTYSGRCAAWFSGGGATAKAAQASPTLFLPQLLLYNLNALSNSTSKHLETNVRCAFGSLVFRS